MNQFSKRLFRIFSITLLITIAISCTQSSTQTRTTNVPGQTLPGGSLTFTATEAQTATPLVIHATHTPGPTPSYTEVNGWKCIDSTTDFLYQMTEIDRYEDIRYHFDDIYPRYPWIGFAVIPDQVITDTSEHGTIILRLVRRFGDKKELWIQNGDNYIRYASSSGEFSIINNQPTDFLGEYYSNAFVINIFVLPDGRIIGMNYPIDYDPEWPEGIPLLSIFNEDLNAFQFFNTGLEFPYNKVIYSSEERGGRFGTIIKFDGSLLWIYQQNDGLFSYSPQTEELIQYSFLLDGLVQQIVISPDGKLLFQNDYSRDSWSLEPGELVLFDPLSSTASEIPVPEPHWPDYRSYLFSETGELWIGMHGYRSVDGKWHLMNPKRYSYLQIGASTISYNWLQPDLALISSDGVLWYTNMESDALSVNGAAWYNPANKTSCWFTTEYGNIVEDENHNLWMVAGNRIYQYSLPEN